MSIKSIDILTLVDADDTIVTETKRIKIIGEDYPVDYAIGDSKRLFMEVENE